MQIRVLLIEGSPTSAFLIRRRLSYSQQVRTQPIHFEIFQADRLSIGLKCLMEADFDIVLLNLFLPDSADLETFQRLHQQAPHLPVIILISHEDEQLANMAMQTGAQDYLIKGRFDGQVLTRAICYAIERQALMIDLENHMRQLPAGEMRLQQMKSVREQTVGLMTANAELARAARLKDEFLASMSHELRTPLNAILGTVEVLQEQIYGTLNEYQVKSLKSLEESGRHLLQLINDILDVAKVEAGKLTMKIAPVSIEEVCRASLRLIREEAARKGLKISSMLPTSIEVIQADERRLKQILVNLLSNAVKFTPDGGTIGLDVVNDSQRQIVHFTVWDTGIGISGQDKERLFQPFVQLSSDLPQSYSGTGLGLSLVYRMAELHDGQVAVESEVGRGSRFTVSLPWAGPQIVVGTTQPLIQTNSEIPQDDEAEIATATKSGEAALPVEKLFSQKPGRVLLVEDSEENIKTFSDYLAFKNYEVIVARNGEQAIELARQIHPDLILMDIQMPEMDGLEATRRLRADPELAATPVIALTALAMPGDQELCFHAGVNDYLSKPVSLKKLAKVVEAYLSH